MTNPTQHWENSPAYKAYLKLGRLPKKCPAFEMSGKSPIVHRGEVWCRMPGDGQQGLCANHQYSDRACIATHFKSAISGHLKSYGPPLQGSLDWNSIIEFYKYLMRYENYKGKSGQDIGGKSVKAAAGPETSVKSLLSGKNSSTGGKQPEPGVMLGSHEQELPKRKKQNHERGESMIHQKYMSLQGNLNRTASTSNTIEKPSIGNRAFLGAEQQCGMNTENVQEESRMSKKQRIDQIASAANMELSSLRSGLHGTPLWKDPQLQTDRSIIIDLTQDEKETSDSDPAAVQIEPTVAAVEERPVTASTALPDPISTKSAMSPRPEGKRADNSEADEQDVILDQIEVRITSQLLQNQLRDINNLRRLRAIRKRKAGVE